MNEFTIILVISYISIYAKSVDIRIDQLLEDSAMGAEMIRENQTLMIISVREQPQFAGVAISYFQSKWANEHTMMVYEDCIMHGIDTTSPLPQWYLLMDGDTIVGCAGLITNDFISRMDLYPWVCAVYIEEAYRGHAYGSLLLERAKTDAKQGGFTHLYLSTDHVGFYEKYGFEKIGMGYHPWGDQSQIYSTML
jgi:GNAT superfamily N-acetyltransferase